MERYKKLFLRVACRQRHKPRGGPAAPRITKRGAITMTIARENWLEATIEKAVNMKTAPETDEGLDEILSALSIETGYEIDFLREIWNECAADGDGFDHFVGVTLEFDW
jgi:hypothetical protein